VVVSLQSFLLFFTFPMQHLVWYFWEIFLFTSGWKVRNLPFQIYLPGWLWLNLVQRLEPDKKQTKRNKIPPTAPLNLTSMLVFNMKGVYKKNNFQGVHLNGNQQQTGIAWQLLSNYQNKHISQNDRNRKTVRFVHPSYLKRWLDGL